MKSKKNPKKQEKKTREIEAIIKSAKDKREKQKTKVKGERQK
jgi:hypothetical protein